MDERLIQQQEQELAKTGRYYLHVCFMTIPLLCMACFLYGLRPLLLCGAALLTGNLCDRLVSLLRRRVYRAGDFSNESFALIIALLMPATVDWYVVIMAVLAGVLMGKEVFGGYGSYPFNPAAVGYAVAAVSWPEQVFRYPQPYTNIPLWDATGVPVSSTISDTLRSGGSLNIGAISLVLGEYAAPMGTGAALILLACGLFLWLQKDIRLGASVSFVVTCALIAFLFPRQVGVNGVDIALRWVNGYDTTIMSFVNIVETPGGGTHVDGFMNAITKQIRKAVEDNARKLKVNMKDSAMKVERDDIQAGLVAVVTARVAEPQFQGQTKDVLGTAQVKPIVTRLTDKQFGEMITGSKRGYKEQSGRVLEKIVGEMHARIQSRKAKEVTRRKNALESASMPAKLSDCQPGNDDVAELFIVEGDSALGTAKAARNAGFQALLPIRGKILNVQKASITQMLSNKECAAIIQVVGAGSGQSFDIEQSRYHKIIMMTDADVDGAHIRILLLTLFYRYMRPLIEHGYVYAAVPPLHRIALTGSHKGEYIYTYSDDELAGKLADLDKKHIGYNDDIQRYKGLGEMDADQLADTTMDPRTRMLRRIRMEDAAQASEIFSLLMGDDVPPRKQFIVDNADDFDRSKIDT